VAPATLCNNFKLWTTGSLPTGTDITINSTEVNTYVKPVATESVQGTRASILDYNAGNKLDIAGELVNIGDKTSFIVPQLELQDNATLGESTLEVFYSYDEI
jgi:hypothetical protein